MHRYIYRRVFLNHALKLHALLAFYPQVYKPRALHSLPIFVSFTAILIVQLFAPVLLLARTTAAVFLGFLCKRN
jgi:hypothetical protein